MGAVSSWLITKAMIIWFKSELRKINRLIAENRVLDNTVRRVRLLNPSAFKHDPL